MSEEIGKETNGDNLYNVGRIKCCKKTLIRLDVYKYNIN